MKLSEKRNSTFEPHPETDGPIKAVLVDITELKKRMTQWGEKEEFRFVFETEVMDEKNDRRYCIWSRGYTAHLNEKAALRKDLKKLMGRDLTPAELDEFDLEDLIGHGVKLIIQHEHKDDRTYANISFMALDRDEALKPSGKYIRVRDRATDAPAAQTEAKAEATGWESVEVHVGKYKGKALGEVDEVGVGSLIEKWLPKAKADGKAEDAALIAALTELADILGGDDY
jgi:hypothetical protein